MALPALRTVEIDLAAWGVATPGATPNAGRATGQIQLIEEDGVTDRLRWVADHLLMQGILADHSDTGDPLTFAVFPSSTSGLEDTFYRLTLIAGGVTRVIDFTLPAGTTMFSVHPMAVLNDHIYWGTSIDDVPEGDELTLDAGANGAVTISAYAGGMHVLVARPEGLGDLVSVLRSDDVSQTNQIGAFTKYASTVVPTGEIDDFSVWVSNQELDQASAVTWTAR